MKHAIHIDALNKHLGVLGTTGSGKSYTARGLLERFIDHHIEIDAGMPRVCIVDPKGDWFGIRLDADGKRAAEDFIIIGGPRADAGLRIDDNVAESMAKPIASMVATSDARIIVDLSDLSASKMRRFTAAFLQALYTENRKPLHLIVDEADEFAPQSNKGDPAAALSLGAMERIAKRGRQRGFRLWMVTQRPASLHKDVLGMAQTVVAMKMGLPHDRKAVGEWIKGQVEAATEKEQKAVEQELVNSLPTLERGEGWVWEIGSRPQRMKFPKIRTFDSMKTPEAGDDFGTIDLPTIDTSTLGTTLAGLVEQQKADDPKELHKRIDELEKQLKAKPATLNVNLNEQVVEKAIEETRDAMMGERDQLAVRVNHMAETIETLSTRLGLIRSSGLEMAAQIANDLRNLITQGTSVEEASLPRLARVDVYRAGPTPQHNGTMRKPTEKYSGFDSAEKAGNHRAISPKHVDNRPSAALPVSNLSGPARRVLEGIHWCHSIGKEEAPRALAAVACGYSPTSKGFKNPLGALRTAGLIEYPADGTVKLTEAGWGYAPATPPMVSLADLHKKVLSTVKGPEHKILEPLLKQFGGGPVSRDELAAAAGYSPTSKGFKNPLGALRSFGFVIYPNDGAVQAAAILYPEGVR